MSDYFLIAEIKDVFNSDGSVIIKSISDFPERFVELKKIFIDYLGEKKEISINSIKKIDKKLVFKFEGFNSISDVQFLLGKKIYVDSSGLIKLPKDTFFIHDLIGSEIYFENEFFGIVTDVLRLPNNDVYVVKNKHGNEIMIPALKKFFKRVSEIDKKLFLSEESKMFFNDEN